MNNEELIREYLKSKDDGYLFHREARDLEFKEQFNLAGLVEYYKDFAAFANNTGGYIIYGVKDTPRIPIGMNEGSYDQFNKIDPQKITGHLNEIFSSEIVWDLNDYLIDGKKYGVFYVHPANNKPIIARKNQGKQEDSTAIIKDGEIYYRYGGRTELIKSSELQSIFNDKIRENNAVVQKLIDKIIKVGPTKAAILDTEEGLIENTKDQVLLIDQELIPKIKFIREGDFKQKNGKTALKLVGDVKMIDAVEVTKTKAERLTEIYPLASMDLVNEIKRKRPNIKLQDVWNTIKENDIKNNTSYSAYVFKNKRQENEFYTTGVLAKGTPSIYKDDAIDFVIHLFDNKH